MSYLRIFLVEIKKKKNVIFEISINECVKNEFLTHIVCFGILGFFFSEGPWSTFSEGWGSGTGTSPLYKVCLIFVTALI